MIKVHCKQISCIADIVNILFPVVTGGSDGIGLAYAKELARRHMNIVLLSRSPDKLKKAADEIGICMSTFL